MTKHKSKEKRDSIHSHSPKTNFEVDSSESDMTKYECSSSIPEKNLELQAIISQACKDASNHFSYDGINHSKVVTYGMETKPAKEIIIENRSDSQDFLSILCPAEDLIKDQDPHSPLQVSKKVKLVIQKWGAVEPINPERFFLKMLLSRGYPTKMIPALNSQYRR
jgi:hypothetical protein